MDAYCSLLHQKFYDILSASYNHSLVRQCLFWYLTAVLNGISCIVVSAADAAGSIATSPGRKMRVIGTVGIYGKYSWPLEHMGRCGGGLVILIADRDTAQVCEMPDRINRRFGGGGGYTPDSENGLMAISRRMGSRHTIWTATQVAPLVQVQ